MLDTLGWPSLECRRQNQRLVFMYEIVYGLVAVPSTHLIPAEHNTISISELSQLHRQYTEIRSFRGRFLPGTLCAVKLWTATLWIASSHISLTNCGALSPSA